MKTFNHDISVRVKLKSNDLVEIVIMDHDTKDVFYYALNFRKTHTIPKCKCESKKPDSKSVKDDQTFIEGTSDSNSEDIESEVGESNDEDSH